MTNSFCPFLHYEEKNWTTKVVFSPVMRCLSAGGSQLGNRVLVNGEDGKGEDKERTENAAFE